MNVDVLWQNFLNQIKDELSSLAYTTWFVDTKLYKLENGKATIIVPMQIHKKHMEDNYLDQIIRRRSKRNRKRKIHRKSGKFTDGSSSSK